jgi:putative membrane protein
VPPAADVLAHAGSSVSDLSWLLPVVAGALPVLLYLLAVRRVQETGRRWDPFRTAAFTCGAGGVGLALSPLLDEQTLTGHMAQHVVLGMLAPIALVLGAPLTLVLSVAQLRMRRRLAGLLRARPVHLVSHPTTAGLLVLAGLYGLYLTPLYALTLRSEPVHLLVHLHVLLVGCLYAWAIAGPDPAPRRPGIGVRLAVVVLVGGAHGFLAKLLYSRADAWPSGAGMPAAEVEEAAQWMYYGGHLADVVLLIALLSAWYARRGRELRRVRRLVASPARA